jgi:myo-inositol-1-phosphate synthase
MLRHGTTGVWFIGARGSVATTSMVGIAALSDDRSDRTGLLTALPIFDTVALPAFGELIAGGHELTSTPLVKRAEALVDAGVLPREGLPAATVAWL